MSGLLPGGIGPWHRFDDDKKHHFSQLLLKRCMEDRNPLLIEIEDKFQSRALVEEKGVCKLAHLHHWSTETHKVPWDSLPEQCVIKPNHWTGNCLFIMDNGAKPLQNVKRRFRPWARAKNGYRVIRNGRDQYGMPWSKRRIERALKHCLKQPFPVQLEWAAANIEPRGVMVEELLIDQGGLPHDWKVHVFHGKAGFIQYDTGRVGEHFQAIYTPEGERIEQNDPLWNQGAMPQALTSVLERSLIESLISISESLAQGIDYTRVDMFLVEDEWVFGEFTNYHNSCHPQSLEWEELGGALWLGNNP